MSEKFLRVTVQFDVRYDPINYEDGVTEDKAIEIEKDNILDSNASLDELWEISDPEYDKVTVEIVER